MNLVERAKNILLTPKTEWPVVAGESDTLSSLLTSYVIPLAAIPAIAGLLNGLVIFPGAGTRFVAITAIITYVSTILSYVITTYAVDLLATNFKSEKDLNKSAQLVAFSSTASWVAGILGIIPVIGAMAGFAGGIYSIYLMYLGVGPMKKTPEDSKVIYMVVVGVVLIATSMVVASILGMVLLTAGIMY